LEWTTRSINNIHCTRVLKLRVGDNHSNSKLTKLSVEIARDKYKSKSATIKQLAYENCVSETAMRRAVSGITWSNKND
jgi:hypothetical protein